MKLSRNLFTKKKKNFFLRFIEIFFGLKKFTNFLEKFLKSVFFLKDRNFILKTVGFLKNTPFKFEEVFNFKKIILLKIKYFYSNFIKTIY